MVNIIIYEVSYVLGKSGGNNEEKYVWQWITWSMISWPSINLFAAPRTPFSEERLRRSSTGYCAFCVAKAPSVLANWPKRLASPAVRLLLLANAWKRRGW